MPAVCLDGKAQFHSEEEEEDVYGLRRRGWTGTNWETALVSSFSSLLKILREQVIVHDAWQTKSTELPFSSEKESLGLSNQRDCLNTLLSMP